MKPSKFEFLFIRFFCCFVSSCSETQASNSEDWEISNPCHHRITSIKVSSGVFVDSIQLFAHNPKTGEYSLGKAGGGGGKIKTIRLGVDEKLIKIFGKKGVCIDSISFETNRRKYGPYGGSGGIKNFEYKGEICGLRGRQGYFFADVIKNIEVITFPYQINAMIENFQYGTIQENTIAQHTKLIDLIENRTIINKSEAQIFETVTYEKNISNVFTYGFRESLIFATKTEIKAGVPFTNSLTSEFSISGGLEANQQFTTTNTVTYSLARQVNVPKGESVKISSYIRWLENLEVPFTADVKITASVNIDKAADGECIRDILINNDFKGHITKIEREAVWAKISGNFAGAYGLDSAFSVHSINASYG